MTTRIPPSPALAVVGAWLVTGCVVVSGDRQAGELGNGGFYWVCSTAADPACSEAGEVAEAFPEAVALGSAFRMEYVSNAVGALNVASGSAHIVETNLVGRLEAVVPGFASVVVYRDGELYDYLHLDVRPVDDVALRSSVRPTGLVVGQSASVQMEQRCSGEPCAGTLPLQWTVDRPEVLWLQKPFGRTAEVTIEAVTPGDATVHVVKDDLSLASLSITVLADELPTSTGDTGGSSTGDTGGVR